jgi:hypothetical protein
VPVTKAWMSKRQSRTTSSACTASVTWSCDAAFQGQTKRCRQSTPQKAMKNTHLIIRYLSCHRSAALPNGKLFEQCLGTNVGYADSLANIISLHAFSSSSQTCIYSMRCAVEHTLDLVLSLVPRVCCIRRSAACCLQCQEWVLKIYSF